MSQSSKRGKDFETEIAKILQKKLGARVIRDGRSGAGSHQKNDIKDWHRDVPFDIECKDQEAIKIKEWMRQAEQAASFGRVPCMVFRMDGKAYATLPFDALVDLAVEIADLQAALDDMRNPTHSTAKAKGLQRTRNAAKTREAIEPDTMAAVDKKRSQGANTDRNGHITDQWGYCATKGCQYSRGYKPPKGKK